MEEKWKPIKGYEGIYEISDKGRVKSFKEDEDKIIKGFNLHGYIVSELRKENVGKNFRHHRLVAEAFIPNVYGKPFVNHVDGVKDNNHVSNLEWCTQKENMQHAFRTGLIFIENNSGPSKEVDQFSLEGEYLETYPSQAEALRRNGLKTNHINGVCLGKRKSSGGFMWRYSKNEKKDIEPIKYKKKIKR